MGLPATDVLLSDAAEAALNDLERGAPPGEAIARRVRRLRAVLLADYLHGEVVRRAFIPRALKDKYENDNLYVEDLPTYWRLLYTVVHAGQERYVLVLEIVDHRTYSRWFPGRGK
jgi:hypothetical protein